MPTQPFARPRNPPRATLGYATVEPLLAAMLCTLGGILIAHSRRSRQAAAEADEEARARLMMGGLCPHGWTAELRVGGVPRGGEQPVELEWSELMDGGAPAVVRRVSAKTINGALRAMVEDRRTDQLLERIERATSPSDDPWSAS